MRAIDVSAFGDWQPSAPYIWNPALSRFASQWLFGHVI